MAQHALHQCAHHRRHAARQPYAGEVLVQGNRIARVGRGGRAVPDRSAPR